MGWDGGGEGRGESSAGRSNRVTLAKDPGKSRYRPLVMGDLSTRPHRLLVCGLPQLGQFLLQVWRLYRTYLKRPGELGGGGAKHPACSSGSILSCLVQP